MLHERKEVVAHNKFTVTHTERFVRSVSDQSEHPRAGPCAGACTWPCGRNMMRTSGK
jgi:hypothetical protein